MCLQLPLEMLGVELENMAGNLLVVMWRPVCTIALINKRKNGLGLKDTGLERRILKVSSRPCHNLYRMNSGKSLSLYVSWLSISKMGGKRRKKAIILH